MFKTEAVPTLPIPWHICIAPALRLSHFEAVCFIKAVCQTTGALKTENSSYKTKNKESNMAFILKGLSSTYCLSIYSFGCYP